MGDSLDGTAVLPDVAAAPPEKVVAYLRYDEYRIWVDVDST